MTEQHLLDALLLIAFVLAPRMTARFFLPASSAYPIAHVFAVVVVVVTHIATSGFAPAIGGVVWGLFCAFGAASAVRQLGRRVFTFVGAATGVPFAFSIVSAVWFFAARTDAHLLGYGVAFSCYAALHGAVLGWMFVGVVAALAQRRGSVPLAAVCFVAFALFLCVAFGIDGVPVLKAVGVVGFSVLVPGVIAWHAFHVRTQGGPALWWSLTSLGAVVVTMGLALANEFWLAFPRALAGLPTMVVVHGVLNAVVVVPCFFMAVLSSTTSTSTTASTSTISM